MKVYLIRHSETKGNRKRRYIGKTDEPLCDEGIRKLRKYCEAKGYPAAERVYRSPMKRCAQTAEIIYPRQEALVVRELSECDFGLFENKSCGELSDCPGYQEWVDSGGTLPFPKGESREHFRKRSLRGFVRSVQACIRAGISSAAFVVHGGTIMCIMEEYAFPEGSYFDYQTENGEGYELIIADRDFSDSRIFDGFVTGGSESLVSSCEADRTFDYGSGKNYKKLFSKDEDR